MCLTGCVILLTLPILLPGCPTENGPPFSSRQPSSCFRGPVLCKNMQKTYCWPCKTNRSESGRQFQRFYCEKALVGWLSSPPRQTTGAIFYLVGLHLLELLAPPQICPDRVCRKEGRHRVGHGCPLLEPQLKPNPEPHFIVIN